jgi:hypothetical protein
LTIWNHTGHRKTENSIILKILGIWLVLIPVYSNRIFFILSGTQSSSPRHNPDEDTGQSKKDTIAHSPIKQPSIQLCCRLRPNLNRKYWKVPLVYGGFAAFGYFKNGTTINTTPISKLTTTG